MTPPSRATSTLRARRSARSRLRTPLRDADRASAGGTRPGTFVGECHLSLAQLETAGWLITHRAARELYGGVRGRPVMPMFEATLAH